jgi:hypothetical protein
VPEPAGPFIVEEQAVMKIEHARNMENRSIAFMSQFPMTKSIVHEKNRF